MFEQTKKFCQVLLDQGVPGLDLAVYDNGKCVLRHQAGYRDLKNRLPMTGNERYNLYSCSKPITCAAALLLWEQGRFSLEDRLCDYMPEFTHMQVKTPEGLRPAKNPILIRHLFEMTAGLNYVISAAQWSQKAREATDGRCDTRRAIACLAGEALEFEPGQGWRYSLCHDVLVALVEVVSGQSFEDFVQQNIFIPLGMTRTTYLLPEAERDGLTNQYAYSAEQKKAVERDRGNGFVIGPEYASGGAGCVSTVDDYMKFLEGLRTGRILKPETLRLMYTDRLTELQRAQYISKKYYGYGLGVRCPDSRGLRTDFGWSGAAGSHLSIDPATGMSGFLAMHMLSAPTAPYRGMAFRFARAELYGTETLEKLKQELKSDHGITMD